MVYAGFKVYKKPLWHSYVIRNQEEGHICNETIQLTTFLASSWDVPKHVHNHGEYCTLAVPMEFMLFGFIATSLLKL